MKVVAKAVRMLERTERAVVAARAIERTARSVAGEVKRWTDKRRPARRDG